MVEHTEAEGERASGAGPLYPAAGLGRPKSHVAVHPRRTLIKDPSVTSFLRELTFKRAQRHRFAHSDPDLSIQIFRVDLCVTITLHL